MLISLILNENAFNCSHDMFGLQHPQFHGCYRYCPYMNRLYSPHNLYVRSGVIPRFHHHIQYHAYLLSRILPHNVIAHPCRLKIRNTSLNCLSCWNYQNCQNCQNLKKSPNQMKKNVTENCRD